MQMRIEILWTWQSAGFVFTQELVTGILFTGRVVGLGTHTFAAGNWSV